MVEGELVRPLEDQQRGSLEHRRAEGNSTDAFSLLTEQLGGRVFEKMAQCEMCEAGVYAG